MDQVDRERGGTFGGAVFRQIGRAELALASRRPRRPGCGSTGSARPGCARSSSPGSPGPGWSRGRCSARRWRWARMPATRRATTWRTGEALFRACRAGALRVLERREARTSTTRPSGCCCSRSGSWSLLRRTAPAAGRAAAARAGRPVRLQPHDPHDALGADHARGRGSRARACSPGCRPSTRTARRRTCWRRPGGRWSGFPAETRLDLALHVPPVAAHRQRREDRDHRQAREQRPAHLAGDRRPGWPGRGWPTPGARPG